MSCDPLASKNRPTFRADSEANTSLTSVQERQFKSSSAEGGAIPVWRVQRRTRISVIGILLTRDRTQVASWILAVVRA